MTSAHKTPYNAPHRRTSVPAWGALLVLVRRGALVWACAALAGACSGDAAPPSAFTDVVDVDADDAEQDVVDVLVDVLGDSASDAAPDTAAPDATADAADPIVFGAPRRAPTGTEVQYFVAAHQDDDLLFMNPDLLNAIRSGASIRTVYVTAGDACGTRDPALRAAGVRAAYSQMLTGQADADAGWECGHTRLGATPVWVCERAGAQHVSLVFLGLPDCAPALDGMRLGERVSVVTEPPTSLNFEDLVALLMVEIEAIAPTAVHALDASEVYGIDNPDHVLSALAAYESVRRLGLTAPYREHRTYNVQEEPLNVHVDDIEAIWASVQAYCGPSEEGDERCARGSGVPFWEWTRRQLVIERLTGVLPRLGRAQQCLGAVAGAPGTGACDGSVGIAAGVSDWQIRLGSRCLQAAGSRLAWGTCGGLETRFGMMSNGQVRAAAGSCVTRQDGAWAVQACAASDAAEPALAQSLSSQRNAVSATGPFADGALEGQGYRSFLMGDVDGDGIVDACIRASAGVLCGAGTGAVETGAVGAVAFSDPTLWSADFSDANGWAFEARDGSLRLGDVTGDGRADLCGLGTLGILCAASAAASGPELGAFDPAALWAGDVFAADAAAWEEQSRWGSFALHDVTGDGRADACARFTDGVRCAVSSGATFDTPTVWLAGDFDDASGWDTPAFGATIRFGDVNGDGHADVCGRGALGPFCALGDGTSFGSPRFWGYRTSLSDVSGWPGREQFWASLALVDVNDDGRDDLCVRAPDGLQCGWSTGTTFARLQAVGGFSDADGWGTETHGGSVRWGHVDGDGQPDVCARGPEGVRCSLSSR